MNAAGRRVPPSSWTVGVCVLVTMLIGLGLAGGTSAVAAGPPAEAIAYAGGDQRAPITSEFGSQLEVRVLSADGEPADGAEVTFQLPVGGPGATFGSGAPLTAVASTDGNGIARSPALSANTQAGPWTASGAVAGLETTVSFGMANDPATTGVALYSTPDSSRPGQPAVFTASVGAVPSTAGLPPGNITFEADGSPIGQPVPVDDSGVAESHPIILDVGGHVVKASFEATTANFAGSVGETTHEVDRGRAVITVSSTPNPSAAAGVVQLSATVAPVPPATGQPTGTVRFTVDGEDAGSPVTVSAGTAEASVPIATAGSHVVRATYTGDSAFQTARAVTVQSVGDDATATTLTSSGAAPAFGSPLTFTATVSGTPSPTGEVTFSASGQEDGLFELCADVTLISGQAECETAQPLQAGEYEVVAAFEPGQQGVEPSAGRLNQIIVEAPAGIELDASPNPATFGAGFELDASVTASVGDPADLSGSVIFAANGASLGDPVPLDGARATVLPDGTLGLPGGAQAVSATYGGDRDFLDASSAIVVPIDPAATGLDLVSSGNPAAFGQPVGLTAGVDAAGSIPGPVEGSVQFWVDGADRGDPVPLVNGSARTSFPGLETGDHDIRAYFAGSRGFGPSEGSVIQTVDSPPPLSGGILPCSNRRIVLTAAYRTGDSVRFEGVARFALVGTKVRITVGDRTVAWTNVQSDGTFWTRASDPAGRITGATRFRAVAGGQRSWPRRLRQAVTLDERVTPGTKRKGVSRVRVSVAGKGNRELRIERQTGCRKNRVISVKRTATSGGRRIVGLPRPAKGEPYAIYRIRAGKGNDVSSPIVVRSAR